MVKNVESAPSLATLLPSPPHRTYVYSSLTIPQSITVVCVSLVVQFISVPVPALLLPLHFGWKLLYDGARFQVGGASLQLRLLNTTVSSIVANSASNTEGIVLNPQGPPLNGCLSAAIRRGTNVYRNPRRFSKVENYI
jgi:hypothetical protein